jgi:hypothetical protein
MLGRLAEGGKEDSRKKEWAKDIWKKGGQLSTKITRTRVNVKVNHENALAGVTGCGDTGS